jgi:hypothetical protein
MQYFSVNFHFLNKDKSYNRYFFTIDTIDDRLSFHGIESVLSLNIFGLVLYAMSIEHDLIDQASWSNQCDRIV